MEQRLFDTQVLLAAGGLRTSSLGSQMKKAMCDQGVARGEVGLWGAQVEQECGHARQEVVSSRVAGPKYCESV